jgi:hypothetical protein
MFAATLSISPHISNLHELYPDITKEAVKVD